MTLSQPGECWVTISARRKSFLRQLITVAGRLVMVELMSTDQRSLNGGASFVASLGNASEVSVEINGIPSVGISARPGLRACRFGSHTRCCDQYGQRGSSNFFGHQILQSNRLKMLGDPHITCGNEQRSGGVIASISDVLTRNQTSSVVRISPPIGGNSALICRDRSIFSKAKENGLGTSFFASPAENSSKGWYFATAEP